MRRGGITSSGQGRNHEIHELEDRKKAGFQAEERYRHDMEPFLVRSGKRVDQLRLQPKPFAMSLRRWTTSTGSGESRTQQIYEAETLSRAMDRLSQPGRKFLIFSGSAVALVVFSSSPSSIISQEFTTKTLW